MKKQLLILTLAALLLAGCGATSAAESTVPAQSESAAAAETPDTAEAIPAAALPDGVYTAEFKTDSSMFHPNEACNGKGTLTVENGVMTNFVMNDKCAAGTGRFLDVMARVLEVKVEELGDLAAKLRAFGFDLYEIDGHDLDAIEAALSAPVTAGKPKAILAHTVKGKGISFMENQVGWHGKAPNEEQRQQALKELED